MRTQLVIGALGIAAIFGVAACSGSPAPASSAGSSAGPSPSVTASAPAAVSTTPAAVSTTSAPAAAASGPAPAATGSCTAQVKAWYIGSGRAEISNIQTTVAALAANEKSGPLATTLQLGQSLRGYDIPSPQNVPMPACGDPAHAWTSMLASYYQAGTDVFHDDIAASQQPLTEGNTSLQTAMGEIAGYTPLTG